MPVGVKRFLPQSGNAIFRRGIRAYGKIASNRLESFKRVAKFQALKLGSIPQMPSAGVSLAGIVIIVIID